MSPASVKALCLLLCNAVQHQQMRWLLVEATLLAHQRNIDSLGLRFCLLGAVDTGHEG